ncbi:sulfite oxidase-like oxidoreductase [Hymenobacter sp. GOD-10R]|uniref:sulfite oxidase-like oxidoreductase n=1 Tax=Hymenobacter sp. GOD-10R TaxID=3093922 RepID=UPI002D795A59|nr:sulfite oxidase-like oxidoreductase [Hymenobacter sp. GOD-10R]WRQ26812.1 sulfite oxidase-like oxidoreductase [Hymenobacter sp. GOD-10R]
MAAFFNKGFGRKRESAASDRIPPGQYETHDFPVLSAGPTPRIALANWTFSLEGLVETPVQWTWEQFNALPQQSFTNDIHCVTKWSRLDTQWQGVSIDTILEHAKLLPEVRYVMAYSYGGYTTNVPLEDLRNGKGFIGLSFGGKPLTPEHGGPARLVVPHLYFWKSAKWINRLRFMDEDEPGFWERGGYSMYGDPWKEQRYRTDDSDQ